jgi:hypothetical protein
MRAKRQKEGGVPSFLNSSDATERHVAWFRELDAWTEYWDVYHPETNGHYYFGNGEDEPGLLTQFLPRENVPPVFIAWKKMALGSGSADDFRKEARASTVAAALSEVDAFVGGLFEKYFGDARDPAVREDYFEATFQFAIDAFPPATERYALIADDDPRKSTAGRHTLDGDIMWFAWALQLEGAEAVLGRDKGHARRLLQLAGVATGCSANFAWRGHRRTRPEYKADDTTRELLRTKGMIWAEDLAAPADEIHALFRIREWGSDD